MNFSLQSKVNQFLVPRPRIGRYAYKVIRFIKGSSDLNCLLHQFGNQGFYPRSVLDVGTNRGEWARNAKTVLKTADFFLIEPQHEMKPFLDRFCDDFPGSKWFNCGAGAKTGELALTIWDDFAGSSFLPEKTALPQRSVYVTTIDDLIERNEIPIPEFVKIDVQGFELNVLEGAKHCFGITEAFLIELAFFRFLPAQPLFHEVVEYMLAKGYIVYDIMGLLRRPIDKALGSADVCFVKEEGVLRATNRWS